MKLQGKVHWFNDTKGFGFLSAVIDGVEKHIFVHISGIAGKGFKTLPDGADVEFQLLETDRGLQADDVRVLDDVSETKRLLKMLNRL